MADGSLATTYSLIYTFLKGRSHEKAAAAVKKAAKDTGVIILKDNIEETEKDDLHEIIKSWKLKLEHATSNSESSSSDSGSSSESDSSDSSSGTSDSDSSSNSRSKGEPSKANGRTPVASKRGKESTSSEDSDSDDESEIEQKPGIGAKPKLQPKTPPKKVNTPSKRKDSSSSSSSDESGSSDSDSSKTTSSSDSSSSSSDESDSESEKKNKTKTKGAKSKPVLEIKVEENIKAIKKRRLSESGQAVVTAVAVEEDIKGLSNSKQNGKPHINGADDNATPSTPVNGNGHNKRPRKSNTPFQRIKAEDIKYHDERLKDNTFMARGGGTNDYGAKANQDLIVTRGDSFRKEKNKKKRGSYRGGEITLQSHSIKFT